MIKKENDLMLNIVANPDFGIEDFYAVGLNADNTSLQDISYYKNNSFILKKFTDESGKFNDKLFQQRYNAAQNSYAIMAGNETNKQTLRTFQHAASNITAQNKDYSSPYEMKVFSNPTRASFGLTAWLESGKPKFSADELAQSSKVLSNPETAGDDFKNAVWDDAPNDAFWHYFDDTLVMAQWDEEGTHIDPITGEKMYHLKGEYKVGPQGTYYYELLGNRDIYGKKVLNKMNIITKDGSDWNKLDFLDSDDRQKSAGGTIMKNLALVGSMFIPYVGPAVTALSLIPSMASLVGTLGKMAVGSDNLFLSHLEGFGKSWELQGNVSEEALQSTWNLENFINLIGDVMALLKQQRFFFEKVPMLFKGEYAGSKKATDALYEKYLENAKKLNSIKLSKLLQNAKNVENMADFVKFNQEFKDISKLEAMALLNSYVDGYNKIGEILSKGYMTAITVHDAYGEAKHAGATDLEATLLTLGYGAAEAWILNSEIGEWILPELHANRAKNRMAIKKLMDSFKTPDELKGKAAEVAEALAADKTNKRKWATNVINKARDFFRGEYFANGAKAGGIVGTTIAGGLGEGVEEVSEEILADVSKGLFNTLQWITNDDTRLSSFGFKWDDKGNRSWDFDDIIDRYGMSFFGGIIGGGLTNLGTNYNINKDIANMDTMLAYLHIVYSARNGGLDNIRRTLEKYKPDTNDYIAAMPTIDSDGTIKLAAEKGKSLTDAAKSIINNIFNFVEDTLNANGLNLSDDLFLDKATLNEWRYLQLYNSQTAIDFLNEYNRTVTEIVKLNGDLNDKQNRLKDTNKDGKTSDNEKTHGEPDPNVQEEITHIKLKINNKLNFLNDYFEGKKATDFVVRAFFELNPYLNKELYNISFPLFVQAEYGKSYQELTKLQLQEAMKAYEVYRKSPENRDNTRYASLILLNMNLAMKDILPLLIENVDSPEYLKAVAAFNRFTNIKKDDVPQTFINKALLNLNYNLTLVDVLRLLDPEAYELLIIAKNTEEENLKNTRQTLLDNLESDYERNRKGIIEKDEYNKQNIKYQNPKTNSRDPNYINEEFTNVSLSQDYINLLKLERDTLKQQKENNSKEWTDKTREEKSKASKRINSLEKAIEILLKYYDSEIKRIDDSTAEELQNLENEHNKKILETNTKAASLILLVYDDTIDNIKNTIINNIQQYTQAIIEKGYIDADLKQEILGIDKYLYDLAEESDSSKQYIESINAIRNLPTDQITGLLNKFSISTQNTPLNFEKLIENIYKLLLKAETVSDIKAFDKTEEEIVNASLNIRLLKAVLKSAMTDTTSILEGNAFGYNAYVNYISEKQGNPLNLALITAEQATPLIHKLDLLEAKLRYVQTIYEFNKGNKFNLNDNAIKALNQARQNSIKHFVNKGDSNPFKDWDEFDKLKQVLTEFTTLDLSNMNANEVDLAKTKVEDAIYEFGSKNRNKFTDEQEMIKVVSEFDVLDNTSSDILNENMSKITDYQFLSYFLSCVALKSSDFYYNLANLDFGGIAPFPPLIEVIRATYATVVDKNIFKTFISSILKSVKNKLKTISPDEFAKLLARNNNISETNALVLSLKDEANKKYWYFSLIVPKFSMISLVEGIAGSGKTQAVDSIIYKLIKSNPDLNKKIYFAHGAETDTAAIKTIADKIFEPDAATVFNRQDLLNHFVKDFKDLIETEKGYEVNKDTIEEKYDEDGNFYIESTLLLKEDAEIPSIIFIDEISLFSELDLSLLNKVAEEKGIHIIASGDFHLNCVKGSIKIDFNGNPDQSYSILPEPTHFLTSYKLGISIRSGNSVKTSNLQKVEHHLTYDKTLTNTVLLDFTYDDDGLLQGDKFIEGRKAEALEELRKLATHLINDEDKITYIYDDENSDMKKAVENDSLLANKVIFKHGSKAQGKETRFSFVDLSETGINNKQNWKFVYTGITRALQGSIIYSHKFLDTSNVKLLYNYIESSYSERGFEKFILNYIEVKQKYLKETYSTGEEIKYNKPSTMQPSQSSLLQPLQTTLATPETISLTFILGEKVTVNGKVGEIINFDGTNYNIKYEDDSIEENVPESNISKYEVPTSTIEDDKKLFPQDTLIDRQDDVCNKVRDEAIDSLKKESLEEKDLLFYQGLLTLEEFIMLVNGQESVLKPTEVGKSLLMYIHKYNNLYYIFTDEETSNKINEYFINKGLVGGKFTVNNISEIGGYTATHISNTVSLMFIENDNFDLLDEHLETDSKNEEDDNDLKILEENRNPNSDSDTPFNILLHSLNTLELGAPIDANGKFIIDLLTGVYTDNNGKLFRRIDSVNGLIKMLDLGLINNVFILDDLKKAIDERNPDYILTVLGQLLSYILNAEDKTKLLNELQSYFGNNNIFINFGFKQIPSRSSRLSGNNGGSNTLFYKDIVNEKTYDLDTTSNDSDLLVNRQIVAIIGDHTAGEVLEIPLFSISNPFTLFRYTDANSNPLYPQLLTYLNSNKEEHEKLKDIIADPNVPQYIKDYCKLYLSNNYFLFRFGNVTKSNNVYVNTDPIFKDWIPSKTFTNLGMMFSLKRGYYLEKQGSLLYSAKEWKPLDEVAGRSKREIYSESVYQTSSNGILLNGEFSVNVDPGRNFILVSGDSSISTDIEMLEYYIKQKNKPSEFPPKVRLIYVSTPKAELTDYFLYLADIISGRTKNLSYKIGYQNTSHKVLSKIIENKQLLDWIKNNRVLDKTIIDTIVNKVKELDLLYNKYIQSKKKEDLNEYLRVLKTYDNNLKNTPYLAFNLFLNLVTNNNNDSESINKIINAIGNIDIRYTTVTDPNKTFAYGARFIKGANKHKFSVGNKLVPFMIHGKLDYYTFSFDLNAKIKNGKSLLQMLAKRCALNRETPEIKSDFYLNYPADTATNTHVNEATQIINKVDSNYTLKLLSYNSIEEALDEFISITNAKPSIKYLVFRDGKNLYKYDKKGILEGGSILFTKDGNPITNIENGTKGTIKIIKGSLEILVDYEKNNGEVIYYEKAKDVDELSDILIEKINNLLGLSDFVLKYLIKDDGTSKYDDLTMFVGDLSEFSELGNAFNIINGLAIDSLDENIKQELLQISESLNEYNNNNVCVIPYKL